MAPLPRRPACAFFYSLVGHHMAKIRCPKCKRFTSVPFRKGVSTCQCCRAYLFFNPERPFFNAGFLLFLVIPFIPLIVELTSSPLDFKKVLAQVGVLPLLLLLPMMIYVPVIVFDSTKTVDPKDIEPQIGGKLMNTKAPTPPSPPQEKTQAHPGVVLGIFVGFLAWCYAYLFVLRPVMNAWLAQYIKGYPAMLHILPLLGVPILLGVVIGKLFSKKTSAGGQ